MSFKDEMTLAACLTFEMYEAAFVNCGMYGEGRGKLTSLG